MKHENQDIVGDKCMKNGEGCLTYDDSTKLKDWTSHYERLLNVEFVWDSNTLPELEPKIGPPLYITEEMTSKVIAKMKTGEAAGPFGIVIKMIGTAGKKIVKIYYKPCKLNYQGRPYSFKLEPFIYCQFV